ncbi:hypothetical protein KFL_001230020 [Klebsormidium nitens]|uniref:Uncharacterized protein n=1 Tax=Klebsormidium nitens TaxID=105231 RepID=A0A1Y1HVU6_KLENI|nr:hypothetical protein KFL_001230020 [Klebsormidium nitens]|eukprot:GAQ82754.1 hypothetical protein KFL_001230020 [Klebsormidium nitens]
MQCSFRFPDNCYEKVPGTMGSWRVLRPQNPLSTFKTASAAVWAIGVIGVLPFANTITNAWFLGTLYLPRVLDCINFVEESPGADPSEFPTISGDLLQALSWICVLLGLMDIGDLLVRLGMYLRQEGVKPWRVKLLVWTTIKWLMIEDELSTHIEGYTHARFREFFFSSGADTIEVFVTASFLFWTGSGYPLATFSLFLSLASVYLTWSFEIAWHLWFLGRRYSPFWPHPTVPSGSPENSHTELLEHRPAKRKKGWTWRPWKRIPPEAKRIADGRGPDVAPAGSGAEETDLQMVAVNLGEPGTVELSEGVGESLPAGEERSRRASLATVEVDGVVTEIVNYLSAPSSEPVSGRVGRWLRDGNGEESESKRRNGNVSGEPQETGVQGANRGSRSGLSRLEEEGLERGYSSEVPAPKDESIALGHFEGEIRNRRTRSLENVDVEAGIIRTLSLASETRPASAGLADNRSGSRRQSINGLDRDQLTEINSLVSETRDPESDMARTESGVSSGANVRSASPPRRRKEIGRGERRLFRIFRGLLLLGMIVAMVVSLWLADFGPGLFYGVGITYLTQISTRVEIRCEPFDAPGTFVDYVVPFNGSRTLDLNGVFFYYTAASNAYIFDSSDAELTSISDHDFVFGALSDRFIAYNQSGDVRNPGSGAVKVRFATVLRRGCYARDDIGHVGTESVRKLHRAPGQEESAPGRAHIRPDWFQI